MTTATPRAGLSWSSRILIIVALLLAGAAGASWALARYDQAARFLGVAPEPAPASVVAEQELATEPEPGPASRSQQPTNQAAEARLNELDARLRRVETAAQRVEGSAGRADALLVAFAARRAIDRGVALGYLEPLLVERFGTTHPRAVAIIVTGATRPVGLKELIAEYRELGPVLRSSAAEAGWLSEVRRELGSLISIRRANRPSIEPDARYQRASDHLADRDVDLALAETMRLPGAARAGDWVRKARQYVTVQRALDEIESAALLGRGRRDGS